MFLQVLPFLQTIIIIHTVQAKVNILFQLFENNSLSGNLKTCKINLEIAVKQISAAKAVAVISIGTIETASA